MSNYFSQLIHQTALSVGSPHRSSARTDSVVNPASDTIQVIDAEAIAAPSNPYTEPNSQAVKKNLPDSLTPTEGIHQNFEIDSEQETRSQTTLSQKGNETTLAKTTLKTNSDFPVQKEPLIPAEIEQTQPLDRFKPDENHQTNPLEPSLQNFDRSRKRIEKTLEQEETAIDVQPANNPPVTASNLIDLRQAYLQAAQDWVAEAPVRIEESREVSALDLAQPEISPANSKPAKPALRTQPIPLEQVYQSEPQRPDIQDLVLSIGSINVTIDAPQAALHLPSVSPANPEARSTPEIQPSRISRYYLR